MRRTFILINNTGIGGAERRFGRLFARMADEDPHATLVINDGLWQKLLVAGIVSGREARVWRLAEPWHRLAKWMGLREGGSAFWLRKLDYLLFMCVLTARYLLAARQVFHLVLGGAYVCLPLLMLRSDHRTVIAAVHNLSLTVGVPWAIPVYRFALMRCGTIDALSEGVRADLIRQGIPDDKIRVSPGSVVDPERFRPALRKEPWVVFSGRLVEEKNPMLFVEAVPAIHRSVPAARFFLLGEGPLRPQIEQTVDRLNLRGVIEIGFCPDPASVLGKARVFVSLQRTENYPSQSLLEAMACGTAVVATDVGLTWKLVDETVGIRVKPDRNCVAEAVVQLLGDPDRAEAMGKRCRDRVLRQHSTETYMGYLERIYEDLGWTPVTAGTASMRARKGNHG